MIRRTFVLPLAACVLAVATTPTGLLAQNSEKLSNKHIPDDAIVAGFVSPAAVLTDPQWEMMPIEVLQAAGLQYVGIDPTHVTSVTVVVGMPGPAGPQAGAVLEFSQDYPIANLNPMILGEFQLNNDQGIPVYESRQQPIVRVHQPNPRTMVIGSGGYLQKMLAAADGGGAGQVPSLFGRISRRKGVTLLAGMQQIRPMVTPLLQQNVSQLPPQLHGIAEIADLTDALFINADYAPMAGSLSVSAIGRDEASATKLEKTVNDAIDFGRMIATTEMKNNVPADGPVNEAMLSYIDRVSLLVAQMLRPERKGTIVQVNLDSNIGTVGIMVGLLLPAVQAAREAARRMTASNEMKQIALAMHNYHATYKKLPDFAIRDENGKALLSWRVAILPFIEQQQLYQEFHLDEPWDSPHNIKLLDRMPTTYVDPSAPVAPGHTVFQVPLGTGLMFEENGERKFRDVLDGLSNTIMVVESSRDAAVPWTQPADLEFDLDNPLVKTGDSHQGGFHVTMADGAVVFLTNSIDLGLLKALLTRAGAEPINAQLNQ